jgi:hypothetical protein
MSDAVDSTPQLIDIELLRIPVPIWAETQEHIDELLREFTLIAARMHEEGGPPDVPVRLMELIAELTQQYGGLNTDQENRLAAAAAAGVEEIDLVYRVPAGAADASIRLNDLLDEADAYCRSGTHLLTLATPPRLVAFRRWFLDQFIDQLAGRVPTPFPEYAG